MTLKGEGGETRANLVGTVRRTGEKIREVEMVTKHSFILFVVL